MGNLLDGFLKIIGINLFDLLHPLVSYLLTFEAKGSSHFFYKFRTLHGRPCKFSIRIWYNLNIISHSFDFIQRHFLLKLRFLRKINLPKVPHCILKSFWGEWPILSLSRLNSCACRLIIWVTIIPRVLNPFEVQIQLFGLFNQSLMLHLVILKFRQSNFSLKCLFYLNNLKLRTQSASVLRDIKMQRTKNQTVAPLR